MVDRINQSIATVENAINNLATLTNANELIVPLYEAQSLYYYYIEKYGVTNDITKDMMDNYLELDALHKKYKSSSGPVGDTSDVDKLTYMLNEVFDGKELREIPKKEDDEGDIIMNRFYKMIEDPKSAKCEDPESPGDIKPSADKLRGLDQEWSNIQTRLFMTMKFKYAELQSGKLVSMLMYGFPGTGKTHLARLISECLGTYFISVSASQIKSKYMGESSKNVKGLFEASRKKYKDSEDQTPQPKVTIFLDEFDGLVGISEVEGGGQSDIVTEFLTEMEGVEEGVNAGLILIAATNRPTKIPANVKSRITTSIRLALPFPPITQSENDELILGSTPPGWMNGKFINFGCKSPAQLIKGRMKSYNILGDLLIDSKDYISEIDDFILSYFTPAGKILGQSTDDDELKIINKMEIDEYEYISQRKVVNFVTQILWLHLVKDAQQLFNSNEKTNWSIVTISKNDKHEERLVPNIPLLYWIPGITIYRLNEGEHIVHKKDIAGSYLTLEKLKTLMVENRSQLVDRFSKSEIGEIDEMDINWQPKKCESTAEELNISTEEESYSSSTEEESYSY
jgi:hypothetical protein